MTVSQFAETFLLPAGFRVELSGISGAVDIECHDGDEAEVRIVGEASVERTDAALVIQGNRDGAATQEMKLRLPRRITLAVKDLHGPLNIGEVDGPVSINSVNGPVTLAGASGVVKINSVSGNVEVGKINAGLSVFSVSGSVSANVAVLNENGIQVKSISGPVELFFEDQVEADINIEQVSGKIKVKLNGFDSNGDEQRSSLHTVVGKGTAPVIISSISGSVRIKGNK